MAENKGIKITISQGLRTIAYQNSLYAQGRTKSGSIVTNARGGYSYHNFGLAFDFAILNKDGKTINWNTSVDLNKDGEKDWFQVAKMGQTIGLESGAFWKGFLDVPHFQITFGLTTAQLRAGKKPPYPADPEVKDLQNTLIKKGYKVTADGIYGSESIKAIEKFQKDNGLKVDGLLGNITYAKLMGNEATPVVKPATSTPSNPEDKGYLIYNDRGDRVKAMQEYLTQVGFPTEPTGYFNAATKRALMDFQEARGMKADGVYGIDSLAEMNKALKELKAPKPSPIIPKKEGVRMFKPSKAVLSRELGELLVKAKEDGIVSSDEWKEALDKGELPLDDAVGLIASYLNRTHK